MANLLTILRMILAVLAIQFLFSGNPSKPSRTITNNVKNTDVMHKDGLPENKN